MNKIICPFNGLYQRSLKISKIKSENFDFILITKRNLKCYLLVSTGGMYIHGNTYRIT